MKPQIEKQLIGRLKFTGWILFVCAIAALVYEYIPQASEELDFLEEEAALELKEAAPLNSFFVSAVFSVVGASCFFISWKKKKGLPTSDE